MSVKTITDASTCERYVAAKLKLAEARIEKLTKTTMELTARICRLKAERDSELSVLIREKGRAEIIRRAHGYYGTPVTSSNGKLIDFNNWANNHISSAYIPSFMSKDEFISEFQQELMDEYNDLVAEAKEEDE